MHRETDFLQCALQLAQRRPGTAKLLVADLVEGFESKQTTIQIFFSLKIKRLRSLGK